MSLFSITAPKYAVALLCFAFWVQTALAQQCQNYGFVNGSSCGCPTGFGGADCSQPACGGDIFQGAQRPLVSGANGNLTQAGCQCEQNWAGMGCNVCQTDAACQAGISASGNGQTISSVGTESGLNSTMVCNRQTRVWASSQMSCDVINPTLQAIYPLGTTLNIIRTLRQSFSPIPNVTSFGGDNSAFASLFYAGVEQFYCSADICQQDLGGNGTESTWTCSNLRCTCIPGTSFCGAVSTSNLTAVINGLTGQLGIRCGAVNNSTGEASCSFIQSTLQSLFGQNGLTLNGCKFGECVRQSIIDTNGNVSDATDDSGGSQLSNGVIAGLAVVGGLLFIAFLFLLLGYINQRKARRAGYTQLGGNKATVQWRDVSYIVAGLSGERFWSFGRKSYLGGDALNNGKVVLDSVNGHVQAGQMMAILGPSGAGKTTLVEILAGKQKSGTVTGTVGFPSALSDSARLRIGFVPQQDILPPQLTVYEALLFAARLRLPESISDIEKHSRVDQILEKLGIASLKDVRIGWNGEGGGRARGISGGEMRRVSIGLELIASPDVLILDEPTSGLDSVSASRVAQVLHSIAHDPENPIPIIASIHQPSSQLYQIFDTLLVLAHGRTLYSGPGSLAPTEYFASLKDGTIPQYKTGYNVADYLLELASDPPLSLFQAPQPSDSVATRVGQAAPTSSQNGSGVEVADSEKAFVTSKEVDTPRASTRVGRFFAGSSYATTALTQFEYLCGREWKILQRDKSLFWTHIAISSVLGVFCGGLYYQTDTSIAGFQSRVGCLFFLGALIAFSSLSALYNIVEIRPLFLRERSSAYYSPTAWLLSRFIFDVIPLRLIPTIIVSTVTYWMAGLSPDAAAFFRFLFILVLYTLAMTLFNFLLGTLFRNGGIAILLSALTALYQMTFAGFFVHLNAIPPVLRWLQWFCPLKYTLEALSVNEVGSGLMIEDSLEGVPVNVSATLIMNLLFGFGSNNYYRDVLVLFAFIAGFGVGVITVVWIKVRERR